MPTYKKITLQSATALLLCPVMPTFAQQAYVEGAVYVAGDQVCYQNDLFQAKWWAGSDDRPSDVDSVAAPWDTPWERLDSDHPECSGNSTANQLPIVETSANPTLPDATGQIPVELIADASDPDGDPLSFDWLQLSNAAPSVTINYADQSQASVLLPEATEPVTYEFQVTVSDSQDSVTESLSFTLEPMPGNRSPQALIQADQLEIVGPGTITLSGSQSSDPDGDSLSYQWQQISPASPLAEFNSSTGIEAQVTLPEPSTDTTYMFELSVSDGYLTDIQAIQITQRLETSSGPVCADWQAAQVYLEGDKVTYNNQIWQAHWWTQGEIPGSTGEWGVWRQAEDPSNCNSGEAGGNPPPPNSGSVKLSELQAAELTLTSDALLSNVKASIRTLDNASVEAISAGHPDNPINVKRVEQIVSEQDWDYLFPHRAPEYTYENFLKAIGKFPAFCGDYSDQRDADSICRKALATMFAHFTQETGGHTSAWPEPEWRQGLVYVRELGWSEDMANGYGLCDPSTWQGESYPCATFENGHSKAGQYKSYFGRGAKQLSYNYNYGPFSLAMFGDVTTLLNQPNLVADTWLNLASAIFFYVYPQPPKPSMLFALDGSWQPNQHDLDNGLSPGFGVTTQIINGGIECGGSSEHIQSQNRIDYYLNFTTYLNVPVAEHEVLGCANMQRFDTQGSGALSIYWEQDWSQANACQRVNYQTPFSALIEGDYVKCVDHYFDVEIDYEN